ncbi:protein kinase domain-containing protein [Saccharothrix texasensis]|uniref:protein kinase domain-containing protein n=1 Tax=Saccharothrix texasensis TaxID=103734 RepID=UPI000F4B6DE8|nr:protein kinase [Saccharothrix texasensis]
MLLADDRPAAPRWFEAGRSRYQHEQSGLDHVRRLMPDREPYRAWATFSFPTPSGHLPECDLLMATPAGLFLVELKDLGEHVTNDGGRFVFRRSGAKRPRVLHNPLQVVDQKSKDLRAQLRRVASRERPGLRVPRVEPAIFLTTPGLRSELDDIHRVRVYGRDGESTGLDWIWRDLLGQVPDEQLVTEDFSAVLPELLRHLGIAAADAYRWFGDWELAPEPLDFGSTWEDRLATRNSGVREEGRLRVYLTAQQATGDARASVERLARREYELLRDITHRGIAQAVQFGHHRDNPAILFRHQTSDLRLDAYLALYGKSLTARQRREMVRQLAEAVRYAHSHSLCHRALAARSVFVSAKTDGTSPVLRIADWQTAFRGDDVSRLSSIGKSSVNGEHLADITDVYLAPEVDAPRADAVRLDVFGLGALAHLIITDEPPAERRSDLIDRLTAERGLRTSGPLGELIFKATRVDVAQRFDSVDSLLFEMDRVERNSIGDEDRDPVDPLTAVPGDRVDKWLVERVLGTGATARVLQVVREIVDDDRTRTERRVFKIALDEEKAVRLRAEARVLAQVGGGVVVRLLNGPRLVSGRTILELEHAGEESLAARLRTGGRLGRRELARFGGDLFSALDQLAARNVRHRDIKPDNLGVLQRADGARQLMLFDFSLADAGPGDIKVGTWGYRDPFLGTADRPLFDDHAELYSAAVTLHEMASGVRPLWGDGTDPRMTDDRLPTIATAEFDPSLAKRLAEFFNRALHRDVEQRFRDLAEIEEAWRTVFGPTRSRRRKPPARPRRVQTAIRTAARPIRSAVDRRRVWMLTALAVTGAVLAAALVADRPASTNQAAPGPTTSSTASSTPRAPTTSPSASGPRIPAATDLTLTFTVDDIAGYRIGDSMIGQSRQRVNVREVITDPESATASSLAAWVSLYQAGAVDPSRLRTGEAVSVAGRTGYYLPAVAEPGYYGANRVGKPTIAVEYANDSWYLVQSDDPLPKARETLLKVAAAVRLGVNRTMRFPVRFDYLPTGLRACGGADGLDPARVGVQPWEGSVELCDDTFGRYDNGSTETGVAIRIGMVADPSYPRPRGSDRIAGRVVDTWSQGATVDCVEFVLIVNVTPSHESRYPEAEIRKILESITVRGVQDRSAWFTGMETLPTIP